MSSLGPQRINLSFGSVLQVPGGLTSSLQPITDGNGIVSGLQLSTTGVSGTIVSDTVEITGGTIDGTDIGSITPATGAFSALTVDGLNGILKASSGIVSTAVSSVDYAPATTGTSILYGDGTGGFSDVTIGAGLSFSAGTLASTSSGGSVTNVSVATANGFSGTVATPSSTPDITLTTTVTGLLKGDGTAISGVTVGNGLSFTGGTLSNSSEMTYPGAGMAVSTGSAWGTSKTTPTGDVVGTSDTQTLTNKTLTSAGSNTVEATSGPTSTQLAGQRNKIINGAMMIDQRNAGAAITSAGNVFTLDRFLIQGSVTGKFNVQQNQGSVTPPAGFTNYLGATSNSAYSITSGDYFIIRQPIEGLNCSDLNWGTANAKTVTLSFYVYSSLTGTFSGHLTNASSARWYPFTYSVSAANTWTYITTTIAGDTTGTWLTNNGTGIYVGWSLGTGSSNQATANTWTASTGIAATGSVNVVATNGATFYITGVQLEKGATATPFENRLYTTELQLCERYYETSFLSSYAPNHGSNTFNPWPISGSLGCGGNSYTIVQFRTPKRTYGGTMRFFDPGASHPQSENWGRYITSCNSGVAVGPNAGISWTSYEKFMSGYMQWGTGVSVFFDYTVDCEL